MILERCSRCKKPLRGWEDEFPSGHISIKHSSMIGFIFCEGAGINCMGTGIKSAKKAERYFESHPAVEYGNAPSQSLIIRYGEDHQYRLCWKCSRELLTTLGKFFIFHEDKNKLDKRN